MVSDFNENWYLGVFWSEELVGIDETCIQMPEFRYEGSLGDFCVCIQTQSNRVICPQTTFGDLSFLHRFLLLLFFLFFFSPWTCPTKFSETDDPIFTKLHRKVDSHLKRCIQVLEFSKWPPFTWKPWTYVKMFDLTYIGNCQRDFHKTWNIYLSRVGRIFWPKKSRMVAIVKMAIVKISMFSDFNENLYVGLFWSEELIGND